MKRICILSAINIRHISLISLYTELMQKEGVEFDIVYMDKYGEPEEFPAKNKYVFTNVTLKYQPRLFSFRILNAFKYLRFIPFAKKILKRNNYDFIIVWNDLTVLLFAGFLARRYKGKYCLNIRDYCFNNLKYVNYRFKKAIDNACFTTISSDGFRRFLPPADYVQVHSLNPALIRKFIPRTSLRLRGEPIRIGFVGYIRFFETNKTILNVFKNDPRFQVCFYGSLAHILRNYAETNDIRNVDFHDSFPVAETYKYVSRIDLMNNLYGHGVVSLDTALSIKLYHSVYNRIPILVCPDTYMAEVVKKYGIGYVVEKYDQQMKEDLYQWYTNLDFEKFGEGCNRFLAEIDEDNKLFTDKYRQYISDRIWE